jgi:DNA repair protein RecO (recombination protein O)
VVSNFLWCLRLERACRQPALLRGEQAAGRRADTPMPLRESEAIVLHTYPLGEGDRLVSFLARNAGRVRGVAAGARRLKSRFGSTLEPVSHIRIWFFERETRDLVRINQCELIESFIDVHKDYAAGVALALLCEVTEAVLPEREPSDAAFRLVLLSARSIRDTGKTALPLAYFALWTVRLGGWLPDLERCARCRRELRDEPAYSAMGHPGIVCGRCRLPGMRVLSPAARLAAREMLAVRLDRLAGDTWPDKVLNEVSGFSLNLIEHQIERQLTSRQMLEPAS